MSNEKPQSAEDHQFDISESSYKTSHTAVRKARRFAMQGLYEWLMTDHRFELTGQSEWKANAPHDIAARTRASNAMHTVHLGYYHEMMREIPLQIEALEALIAKHLDRDISKIDRVEHAVLLIGAYELKNSLHIPYKVVLDESMKLNTHFGATDAHKLINAVMDKLAAELRAIEVDSDTEHKDKVAKAAGETPKVQVGETELKGDIKDKNSKSLSASTTDTADNENIPKTPKPRIGRKKNPLVSVADSSQPANNASTVQSAENKEEANKGEATTLKSALKEALGDSNSLDQSSDNAVLDKPIKE